MSKIRNISSDARHIGYGLPAARKVEPDQVIEVPSNVEENYITTHDGDKAVPSDVWAPVSEAHRKAVHKENPE